MSTGQLRPKWRRLVVIHSTTYDEKLNTPYQHQHLIPTVKHGGVGVIIWAIKMTDDLTQKIIIKAIAVKSWGSNYIFEHSF